MCGFILTKGKRLQKEVFYENMKRRGNGIKQIRYGEIHKYYPVQFEQNCSFEELVDKIETSEIVYNEEYSMIVLSVLAKEAEILTENVNKNLPKSNRIFKVTDLDKYETDVDYSIDKEEIRVELEFDTEFPKFRMVSLELEALEERAKRMNDEYEQSSCFYGKTFTQKQQRFIFRPLKIKLYNGICVWMQAILYLFANNMGIFKLELPLLNTDVEFIENASEIEYIDTISCKWSEQCFSSKTFTEIVKHYLDELHTVISVNIVNYNDSMQNIILVDYDGIPKKMQQISDDVQESLYRMIISPIPRMPEISYKKQARDYFKEYV